MSNNTTSGGGAATHTGTNYQDYVAAWTAVQILAEQDVNPPWGLPVTATLEALHAETPNPIDDLTVHTAAGGRVLTQSKHTVTLATTPTSPLGSTIAQFVAEYTAAPQSFDPRCDRFVLITSPQSSVPVRAGLQRLLQRIRTSSDPDQEWARGNQDEQEAATVLCNHLTREWQTQKGSPPTDSDLTAMALLIHIHTLDVDPGGAAAQAAKDTLRQCVLRSPTAAETAWNTLVMAVGTYAANHQSADRRALQQALTDAGIELQAPRSYRDDIERLNEHTAITLSTLADFSRIYINGQAITITRAAATEARAAASHGHLLILGDPGAGKSGVLYSAAHQLRQQGADTVLFAVDQLDAASTGILRNELGLKHELITILRNWPGGTPGYLMIDALDAARSVGAARTLQSILEQVIGSNTRWHVIASVRKYDLRYATKAQALFHGAPPSPAYTDTEFGTTRHVNIPALTTDELTHLTQQAPALSALVTSAPPALEELLHVPFNLRLLAELFSAGVALTDLQPLSTQAELLDRYWLERIIRDDGHGDGRETVLRRTTDAMVQQRTLRIPRATAMGNEAGASTILNDLLSTHVLAEWTTKIGAAHRDILTFPHHLLFDYAVARLSLRLDPAGLVARLSSEPDLLLAIRPSIELHYRWLWRTDPASFRDLTLKAIRSSMPEIGKLIGPSVLALEAATLEQTQFLLASLSDAGTHQEAIAILQHVLATLVSYETNARAPLDGPWVAFLDRVTTELTPQLSHTVRPYANFLTAHADGLSLVDRERLGKIARRLLACALGRGDTLLMVSSIITVAETAATDVTASLGVLRSCIKQAHLEGYGYRTLPTLARTVASLVSVDADFLHDLYIAAFQHREESNDTTSIGNSQILSMTSNRRQDYDLGLWQLGQQYPAVLNAHPREAIDALLTIVDDYVTTAHPPVDQRVPVKLNGHDTSLLPDYSGIWDEGATSEHDSPVVMLKEFQNFLEKTAAVGAITEYLTQVAQHHPPAVIWRRLLAAGTHRPAIVGYAIRSLAWDHSILTAYDTTHPAGGLLTALCPLLDNQERQRVEEVIMAIPLAEGVNVEIADAYRDRLLRCLDQTLLVTSAAQERYATIMRQGPPPKNEEQPAVTECDGPFAATIDENPALDGLLASVNTFVQQHASAAPTSDAITGFLPAIKELRRVSTTLRHQAQEFSDFSLLSLAVY